MMFKRTILSALLMPIACSALAGFELEGTPALTTETGLLSNRTHYEQDAKATFRMPDAKMVPAQKKYEDANAKMVVDKAYRVVTHKGTGKAAKTSGFADSVPLDSALAMIIPAGWQVYQAKDLKQEALPAAVSFEGGKEWPDVLSALGEYNALRFHLDWYDKVVMMSQGRPVYTASTSRIRIINEPVNGVRNRIFSKSTKKASPVELSAGAAGATKIADASKTSAAVVTPAGSSAPIVSSVSGASGVVVGTPSESVKPAGYALLVREGFLHENIVRLSKENGWNAPDWQIPSDFKIASSFSVSGKSFTEAIAKLLMIHPIEADINTNQRKIYVTREAK